MEMLVMMMMMMMEMTTAVTSARPVFRILHILTHSVAGMNSLTLLRVKYVFL